MEGGKAVVVYSVLSLIFEPKITYTRTHTHTRAVSHNSIRDPAQCLRESARDILELFLDMNHVWP